MTRKISHKGARNKGKNFERYITKRLKSIGIEARRTPMSGALSWLKGDVTEANTVKPHIHECKCTEALSLDTWWLQAVEQVTDEVPVLHFTSNYKPYYTVLRSKDFDDMVYAYEQQKDELSLHIMDLPRKNFWKFTEHHGGKYHAYTKTLQGEEVVIITLDFYIVLRKHEIKHIAHTLLNK